jgi:dihydroxyacetone kinase DhaKLM complex PTS-EIIA-like component DhaM
VALHGQAAWCVINEGRGPSAAARHLMETHPDGDNWVVQQLRAAAGETLRAGAPDAARSYLARALREPPPFDDRAAVLYELGSASLLTEPATTVNHLRAALEEPISDAGLRQNIVYRLSQVLAHSDRLAEASDTLAREIRSPTTPGSSCAWSPSSSCGTPSAPTNPTTPPLPPPHQTRRPPQGPRPHRAVHHRPAYLGRRTPW